MRIGHVAGIPIGIHYTWLIAFVLVTSSLAIGFFPVQYPGWGEATYWLTAALATILLFASVLVHELAHAFVALARGHGVQDITLFIFGGIARIRSEVERPADEFLIAVVGPVASVAVAGIAWALHQVIGPANDPSVAILAYLAYTNALLAGFNLIPAFPLDGGRVFRAILWLITGSMRRATNVASTVGQVAAFGFIALGLLLLFSGNVINGIWIVFTGWFLNNGAETSRRQAATQDLFGSARVADLMTPNPMVVPPRMLVSDFVLDYVIRQGVRAVPVVEEDRLVGIVSITDARVLDPAEWTQQTVARIMTRPPLLAVAPEDDATLGLRLMAERGLNQVVVLNRGEQLVGLLTRAGVMRFLQLREELGAELRISRLRRAPFRSDQPDAS